MDKEGVVTAIKHFILPELKEIKDNQARMSRALEQKTALIPKQKMQPGHGLVGRYP